MTESSIRKILFIALFYLIITTRNTNPIVSAADEMESQNFKIQGGNFNMTSGNKSSTNFRLSDVVGQTAAGTFTSKGYIINAGFLNTAAGSTFLFSVSPPVVDFGILSANLPIEKDVTIKIANGDVNGYLVKVAENQPLSTSVEATIADTICDGAKTGSPCTSKKASEWKRVDAFGFGYRMQGKTVPKDFSKNYYFRSFNATKRNEDPEIIMQTQARKVTDTATMTLRVNTSRSQPVGLYRNVLSFTALAGI